MKTLKVEELYVGGYETFNDLAQRSPRLNEEVYTAKRRQSALDFAARAGRLLADGQCLAPTIRRIGAQLVIDE